MNTSAGGRVLHLVPPNGGGVDRFVRDLCAQRPDDWLLHVTEAQCVVECPHEGVFVPVAATELPSLVARGAFGGAVALHAHSTEPAVRQATRELAAGMRLPYVLTLHDVQFAGAPEAGSSEEGDRRHEFIRAAARCTVPSRFMHDLAVESLGHGFACSIVENGVDGHASAARRVPRESFQLAVIGAVGEHKGLAHLVEVASHLPPELRIALLGYAEGQLGTGWLSPNRIWVHGPFEPAQLPELVSGYGAALAFFPKGQPESYCYALSDAWLAGLTVVGPDWGAIGERVRKHGGGHVYSPDAAAQEVALMIAQQLAQMKAGSGGVTAAVASLTSVATMRETMNNLYAEIAAPPMAPNPEALKLAASNHLDSRFFRKELLRLQGDLAAAGEQRDNALKELQALSGNFESRGAWIEHMQQSCDDLGRSIEALKAQGEQLQQELRQSLERFDSLQANHVALQEDFSSLKATHERLTRRLTAPLRLLPPGLRSWLVKIMKRKLLAEDRNG